MRNRAKGIREEAAVEKPCVIREEATVEKPCVIRKGRKRRRRD